MKMNPLYVFVSMLLPCAMCSPQCVEQHLCYCRLPNNSYIDINPLANVTFDLINTQGEYRYAIDLCKQFNKSDECTDVFTKLVHEASEAAFTSFCSHGILGYCVTSTLPNHPCFPNKCQGCQYNNQTRKFHSLGKELPTFIDVQTLMFENETNKVFVQLLCSESQDDFQFASQFTGNSPFNFTLKSKYACAVNGSSPTNTTTLTPKATTSSSVKTTGSTQPTTGSKYSTSSSGGTTKAAPTSATTQSRVTTTANVPTTTHGGSASTRNLPMTTIITAVVLLSRLLI